MLPIESSNHDKQHMFSLTLEEVFFERSLKYPWLSIYIHVPIMKGRSWNLQEERAWNI